MDSVKTFKTVEEFREFIDLDLDRYKDSVFKSVVKGNAYELFDVIDYYDLGNIFSREYVIGTKFDDLKAIISVDFDTNLDENGHIQLKWSCFNLYINHKIEKFIREA